MRKTGMTLALAAAIAGMPSMAQVVREEGAKPIAGLLYTLPAPQVAFAEWTFRSAGGEVLFASLDADIYRIQAEHEEAAAAVTKAGDSCSDEGGPGLFRLKVLDAADNVLCSASRPAPPPGWQRDPRLACTLPVTRGLQQYRLRVELSPPEDELVQPSYPFLLNVSLRRIAPSGVNIQEAFAISGSGGF